MAGHQINNARGWSRPKELPRGAYLAFCLPKDPLYLYTSPCLSLAKGGTARRAFIIEFIPRGEKSYGARKFEKSLRAPSARLLCARCSSAHAKGRARATNQAHLKVSRRAGQEIPHKSRITHSFRARNKIPWEAELGRCCCRSIRADFRKIFPREIYSDKKG